MSISDWIHDDITWCMNECRNISCFRNLKNKSPTTKVFSAAKLKNTELCPIEQNKFYKNTATEVIKESSKT